jgi:hypothetical protein
VGELDRRDRNEARKIAIVLVVLVSVLALAALLLLPSMAEILQVYFAPGLGLKDAAVIAFFVTLVLMIVFAVAAGDGFLGEIQFMLAAFFLFFLLLWLLTAWIF